MEVSYDSRPPPYFSQSSSFYANQNSSSGIRASNKLRVFDMNSIGNKLSSKELVAPSTRAFQH
jgi:hypothetical protein